MSKDECQGVIQKARNEWKDIFLLTDIRPLSMNSHSKKISHF